MPATVEKRDGGGWDVRLLSGERLSATVRPPCGDALVGECCRTGRLVLVAEDEVESFVILGALQTEPSGATVADDGVVRARDVRIEAERSVQIGTPRASLELTPDGRVRLRGRRMTIDVANLIRLLASKVELP